MIYVDVHAHLFHEDIDAEKAIQEAENVGVKRIINNALSLDSKAKVKRLSINNDICRSALGIYPWDSVSATDTDIETYIEELDMESFVAIGEVGLDYMFDETDDREAITARQKETFSRFIDKGKTLQKPLIIHSRGAEKDVLEMLETQNAFNPVLHSFTGSRKLWKRARDNGYYFSIPCSIVKSTHFQYLVEDVPIHQLLTETDSPYLSPDTYPNTPKNIPLAVKKIANIKSLDEDETAYQIFMNYQRLFTT